MTKTSQLWTVVLGVLTLGTAHGELYVESFSELCSNKLRTGQEQLFYSELGKAEQAIEAGNQGSAASAESADSAESAGSREYERSWEYVDTVMGNAQSAAWRGADFDRYVERDIGVKCLGEQTARRWFTAKMDFYRLLAAEAPGDRSSQTNLIYAAHDGGSPAVVALVSTDRADRFAGSVRTLERIAGQVNVDREFGAYILPEENAIASAIREAVVQLRQVAARKQRAALAAEDEAFNRPFSEQEIAIARGAASAQKATGAIFGVDMDAMDSDESAFFSIRISESQELLSDARGWNLERDGEQTAWPSSQRALKRGDTMLARANDPEQSLQIRDEFYGDAERYFEFGGFNQRASTAASQRAAIQAALQAEQDRREQQMEKARTEMQQKAEATKQAVEDMKKTEAEKQSFNEEADALEAELGF